MQALASSLASAFCAIHAAGIRERETYSTLLLGALRANPVILSAWTVWEPNALDGRDDEFRNADGHDGTGRFIACWHRAGGTSALIATTGYESPGEGDWYWVPKRHLSACRLDPIDYCFGPMKVRITSQICPLILEGRFHGAVGIDMKVPESEIAPAGTTSTSRQRLPATPLVDARISALSPREREVFHWLELGKTNDDIASILGISPHTVKNHLDHMFHKLGVRNRFEAVRLLR